jgi:hypothetical protein
LWIVDGTLVPVRDRTAGASSRNYRFSANVQVIIGADTRLVVAAARPAPGNRADAHTERDEDEAAADQGHAEGEGEHLRRKTTCLTLPVWPTPSPSAVT